MPTTMNIRFNYFAGRVSAFFCAPIRSYDPIAHIAIKNVDGPAGAAIQEVVEFKSLAQAEATVSYLSLRQRFIKMPHKGTSINQAQIKGFEKNFALNEYLSIAMVEVLVEIVELPAWAWFGLEIFFIVFYGWLHITGIAGLALFIGFGYFLLLSIWLLMTSLSRIEKSLTPQGTPRHRRPRARACALSLPAPPLPLSRACVLAGSRANNASLSDDDCS